MNLELKQGSTAQNGVDECVFLIAQCNSIGDTVAEKSGWYRAVIGWQALDDAKDDFGLCAIVKSCLAVDYDIYCKNNQ